MFKTIHIGFLLLFSSAVALGAEISRVDKNGSLVNLKLNNRNQWRINDHLCVAQKRRTLACGQVIRANSRGLIVQLTIEILPIIDNSEVGLIRINPTHRELANILGIQEKTLYQPSDLTHLSAGGLSVLSFWMGLHFEQAVSTHFALGLMPSYYQMAAGNGTIEGFEVMGTFSFYHHSPYQGLWIMLGTGFDVFAATASGTIAGSTSVSMMGMAGWKFFFPNRMTLGIAGGGHYFFTKTAGSFTQPGFILNTVAQVGIVF